MGRLYLGALVLALSTWTAPAAEITEAGKALDNVLGGMHVKKLWIAGEPVDWKTGKEDRSVKQCATHCSAFAAAVCERLGVYLLRPPEHSQVLLANAQHDWLLKEGGKHGWEQVKSWKQAQRDANEGWLVVAIYKNKDKDKPGHAAVVRPSTKSDEKVAEEGPDLIWAGKENHDRGSLLEGFKSHPKDEVLFFKHKIELKKEK